MGVPNPYQVTPPEQLKVLPAAGAPTRLGTSPLSRLREGIYQALAATKVYGSNGPSLSDDANFTRHFVTDAEATAVKKIWTAAQFPALANAFLDAGTLSRENNLRVVVEINGAPITHVASGGTPGAGEFHVVDNASVNEIEFGTAYGAGTKMEIYQVADDGVLILNNDVDLPVSQWHQDNLFLFLLAEDQIVNVSAAASYF